MSFPTEHLEKFIKGKSFTNIGLNIYEEFEQNTIDLCNEGNKNLKFKKIFEKYNKSIDNQSNDNKSIDNQSNDNKSIDNQSNDKNCSNNIINLKGTHSLDNKLESILSNEYFILNVNKKDSFISSILAVIDKDFYSYSNKSKDKMVSEFKSKLISNINENFKKLNYKKKAIKEKVQDNLLNSIYINKETQIYISDLLNTNIIIIHDNFEYSLITEYNNLQNNILLVYNDSIYKSILDGNTNFIENDLISKIFKIYNKKTNLSNSIKKFTTIVKPLSEVGSQYNTGNENSDKLLKDIKKMKINELKEYALKINISITNSEGKKKIKAELIKDILKESN
jgi:hypothetical protein